MPKTICLDFDGVMNTYVGWKGEDELYEPREGLYDFLTKLADKGWDIVVHSTRTVKGIEAWLDKFGLSGFISEVSNTKPPALIYLDDRGITFTGDYDQALELIDNFKVYWQKDGA